MIPVAGLKDPIPADAPLSALSEDASKLGYDVVDIAGFLDQLEAEATSQVEALQDVRRHAEAVIGGSSRVAETVAHVQHSNDQTLATVESSVTVMRESVTRTQNVAGWVKSLADRMSNIEANLKDVKSSNATIAGIAAQVNILAINAKIEAARAGDAGRGFAVVAEAINDLSRKTAVAAKEIEGSIRELAGWIDALGEESGQVSEDAESLLKGAETTDTALTRIATGVRSAVDGNTQIEAQADKVLQAVQTFEPEFSRIGRAIEATGTGIHQSRERAHSLIDRSERIVQGMVSLGGATKDKKFIDQVQMDARRIGVLFEGALRDGAITESALFSTRYQPIPGTDPAQVMAPFTTLTDRLLPEIQEEALRLDPRVVFCAAVDRSGYLPTHNRKFSQPQSDDATWNGANCRNRRIFDDRVGLKAGRNTGPFLLQVYRRDMGGGQFKMMKDLSAPIMVNGRHWGGLRLAYAF